MNTNLTEKEIDDLVIAQADNADAWEKPVFVNQKITGIDISLLNVARPLQAGRLRSICALTIGLPTGL